MQATTRYRGVQQPPRCARGTATLCYQAANLISPRRHCVVARPGVSKPQEASSQSLRSRSRTAQASTHTGSDTARTPEEVKQCIRQHFQDLGSSLEQQPQEVLYPLLSGLLKDGHKEAAVMVINAFLVSTPKPTQEVQATLLSSRAVLEAAYDPQRALQTHSELSQLGGGKAADYRVHAHIRLKENNDPKAAAAALSHAAAICEPSEKFDILVELAWCKRATGDGQGALKDLTEADTLGQLGAAGLILLSELCGHENAAAAIAALDRAALIEPLSVSDTEQRAHYKLTAGDYFGIKADLDAIMALGVNNSVTYKATGLANMQQLETHLTALNHAVSMPADKVCNYNILVCRALVHYKMGNLQDAAVDLNTAHQLQPLSDSD